MPDLLERASLAILNCAAADHITPSAARVVAQAVLDEVAAADLLAACRAIVPFAHSRAEDMHENGGDNDPHWKRADAAVDSAYAAIAKASGTPAGWTHAETSAPDDPTQQPAALRFVKSHAGQSLYQMLDASGSLVAMLTVMVPADGPAVAACLNQALAANRMEPSGDFEAHNFCAPKD